jgi:iduronate 2-sulfatase
MMASQTPFHCHFPRALGTATLLVLLATGTAHFGAKAAEDPPPIRNVLLIISDDLKASTLNAYGDPRCITPHLDALAARSLVFDRAYCQGTWCAPSRLSMMHSRYLGDRGPTLGQHLIRSGFYSARVGKIFHMRVPGDIIDGTDGDDIPETWTERFNCQGPEAHTPGLYRLLNHNIETRDPEGRQSTRMPHRMFASVEGDGDGSDQPDWKAAAKTVELLRQRAGASDPFFIATGFVRPHYPSVAPAKYFRLYPCDEIPIPHVPDGDLDDIPQLGRRGTTSENSGIASFPDNIRKMWADYYATITFMDEQLGKITAELDRLDLWDSTLVIFTSDHGYHLGEHDFWEKSRFHEEVTRVPLFIATPGLSPGRSEALVELVDLYPTICDLAGVPIPETVQGISLRPLLDDPSSSVREAAFALDPRTGHFLRTSRYAYMLYNDDTAELYDMQDDPGQFSNLASRPDHAELEARLRHQIQQRIAALRGPSD